MIDGHLEATPWAGHRPWASLYHSLESSLGQCCPGKWATRQRLQEITLYGAAPTQVCVHTTHTRVVGSVGCISLHCI